MKKIRIAIGPGEVAGYFSGLKNGFDQLNIDCEHFVLGANNFSYKESNYFLKNVFIKTLVLNKSDNKIIKILGQILGCCIKLIVFFYALARSDVFIFAGYGSYFRFYELPLIKLLGKKILVVYLGSDARPPIFSGRHLDDLGTYTNGLSAQNEAKRLLSKIQRVERYADVVINHTATAQFFTRSFIRHVVVGMPMKIVSSKKSIDRMLTKKIRILHAPSRPLAKGSLIFRKIIDELCNEGYLIEFIELVGVSNAIVLKELEQCDFVLDELYSDIPIAMLAAEAAMLGKPSVVGGYYTEQYSWDNPGIDILPSLYVAPVNIKEGIRRLIVDSKFRIELGKRAESFIKNNWNAKQVATNYLRLLEGNAPEEWVSSPADLTYYWGWGLSKENWRMQVHNYVSSMGENALFLDHNPRLKKAVLEESRRYGSGNL